MSDHQSRKEPWQDAQQLFSPEAAGGALCAEEICHSDVGSPVVAAPVTTRILPFLIRRDGTWLYRGTPIARKAMICMFASMLVRDEDGRYWLKTPTEEGVIQVEDAPYAAVALDFRGACGRHQTLCLRTNMDELLCVGPEHPLICDWDRPADDCGAIPYVHVRNGEGDFPILARLTRAVHYELAALVVPGHVEGRPCLGVWSQNCFFPLSRPA